MTDKVDQETAEQKAERERRDAKWREDYRYKKTGEEHLLQVGRIVTLDQERMQRLRDTYAERRSVQGTFAEEFFRLHDKTIARLEDEHTRHIESVIETITKIYHHVEEDNARLKAYQADTRGEIHEEDDGMVAVFEMPTRGRGHRPYAVVELEELATRLRTAGAGDYTLVDIDESEGRTKARIPFPEFVFETRDLVKRKDRWVDTERDSSGPDKPSAQASRGVLMDMFLSNKVGPILAMLLILMVVAAVIVGIVERVLG